jgi:hypothetical protein
MTELAPKTVNRTLRRLPNAAYRQREYLTEAEVAKLIDTARKRGRNGPRDSAAILLAYRHGLRAQEQARITAAQPCCPLNPNERTRLSLQPSGSCIRPSYPPMPR